VRNQIASCAECLSDLFEHECGIAERRQPDPEHAGLEVADHLCCGLDRQPCFAGAARAGQGYEPVGASQESGEFGDLARASDEGRRRPGQVRVRDGLQRREPLGAELEDRHWIGEVLQPVLAEIGCFGLDE
jgi:hypothetical protein